MVSRKITYKKTKKQKKSKKRGGGPTENRAKKTIAKFFKGTTERRTSNFLTIQCPDSSECVTFGKEVPKIKKFFNDFDPQYIVEGGLTRIGAPSNNGMVLEIPYQRDNYKTYTILKSSIRPDADNLFYEAFVGVFINKKNLVYPCFLETYKIYYYDDDDTYLKLGEDGPTKDDFVDGSVRQNKGELNYNFLLNPELINNSCAVSYRWSVCIQHIKSAISLHRIISWSSHDVDLYTVNLVTYLYQVYCPLAHMLNVFTHYDLHADNVLIYKIPDEKYIKMIYHYPDDSTVEFNTDAISKIIDYGRSYMNDEDQRIDSATFYDILCVQDECNTDEAGRCGERRGYGWLGADEHYINSIKKNRSHDLRLLSDIKLNLGGEYRGENSEHMNDIFENLIYESFFGTPERASEPPGSEFGDRINNVEDAHLAFKRIIQTIPYFKVDNDRIFSEKTKLGEMHVWVDGTRNVQFVETSL